MHVDVNGACTPLTPTHAPYACLLHPSVKMMDIEEIDDNSSQEDCPPATTATTTKRAKGKSKKESPAAASTPASSTLTRFLGPAGPPSLSAWEDVNRQCPVCQQTGFSSRSLSLHVNECLDLGSNAGAAAGAPSADDEGEAAGAKERSSRAGAATSKVPTAGPTRRVGSVGAGNAASRVAGTGSRQGEGGGEGGGEGVARETPQAVPSKSLLSETPASNVKAAKKAKTQQDRRGAAAERQRPGVWPCMLIYCCCAVASLGEGPLVVAFVQILWMLRVLRASLACGYM